MPVSHVFNARAVPGKVNVLKDGIYKYFSDIEEDGNGNVFANVTSVLRSFDCTINITDGKYVGNSPEAEIVINKDGSIVTVNGVTIEGCIYKNSDGKLMVSLNGIGKALGYKAEWNESEGTLYIAK